MNNIQIIILAAGKGSRMKSKKPKVLQEIAGKTLLERIIDTSLEITDDISVIYGFGGEQVKNAIKTPVHWIYQEAQNGTGGAVQLALNHIDKNKKTLILYGDVPLITINTLNSLLTADKFNLLTAKLSNPTGYGRVIRESNKIIKIVEQKDATSEELKTDEVNTGIMAISGKLLHKYLPKLSNSNAQNEYYLTDVIQMATGDNIEINSTITTNLLEISGVNDKLQLQQLEREYQLTQAVEFMQQGLTIIDKQRFDNRGSLTFGSDCAIDINVIFEGNNTLGEDVHIGANCIIINSQIADNVEILPNSIIENAIIEAGCTIGPFARIRPETYLKTGVKVGNFVEVKKSTIDENSKVNHLSYIGDSVIGKDVNIGAGTITCNYDGANKHQTIIGDNAFIGSNSALIAPVHIGSGATIGAGSAISKDCEKEKLTLSRSKQLTLNWQRPSKK